MYIVLRIVCYVNTRFDHAQVVNYVLALWHGMFSHNIESYNALSCGKVRYGW